MELPHGGENNTININDHDPHKRNNGFSSDGRDSITLIIPPHEDLPKPKPPPGVVVLDYVVPDSTTEERSLSLPETLEKFIRDKRSSFSAAVTKRMSSFKKEDDGDVVTEFNLLGLKVTKSLKETKDLEIKGRVSFFSRSNCRDCGAVRSFLRERGLNFVEINVDVYPGRERELVERTGGASVPQIFFNEKLIGGLVALNSLRNSGMVERKMEEMLGWKCPDDAPEPPVYGFDEAAVADAPLDEMAAVVRVVRKRVPIQDRISRMKIVKNCFSGADLVEAIIHHFDCGRKKAVEFGKQLARKHFIHHVFGENQFEDGKHLYRFLEHESFIPKCHNFRGSVNDCEPKVAGAVGRRLASLMWAILESYASDDRRHLDYIGISNSEEFRRYVNLVEDLQRIDLLTLSAEEKLAFFLNLYNSMVIHAVIRIGHPGGLMDRRSFFSEFMYVVGGHPYSLSSILNGILRGNRRPPFSLIKPFGAGDKRLELSFPKVNPLVHFGISNATTGSPSVRFFSPNNVQSELRYGAREFFLRGDGMLVDLSNRTVYLTKIIKWYSADFGNESEILKWLMNYLDASKAGLLTHLLSDGGSINTVYNNFDWSINS